MRPWHDNEMSDDELSESVDDAMREEGLDPDNYEERVAFTDRANREAIEDDNAAGMIRNWNHETGEIHPQYEGAEGWFADSAVGRWLVRNA